MAKPATDSISVPRALFPTVLALLTVAPSFAQTPWFEEPDAPGPNVGLTADDLSTVASYTADQPVIGTYLFYWYDVYSGAHVTYGDGGDACTTHPVSWDDYSFHSTRWWLEQLRDICAAGIDFAAPVYWGHPYAHDSWSFHGLPPLVRALDYMERIGEEHPRIALFYDTSTLRHSPAEPDRGIDLSTPDGKAWFYATIRDFFSYVPPRHWAAIEGRPIVLLYAAAFASKQDPDLFPYVRDRFEEDFAVEPYIIAQTSWAGEPDNTCNWGGAINLQLAGCAALGPGYDHSAVRGRQPLIVEREGGDFYERNWRYLLMLHPQRRPNLVMLETWNEFHEGTDIAHSEEYGRQYIDLTRKYADMFHRGERLKPEGPFVGARSVETDFAASEEEPQGLGIVSRADGAFERVQVEGRTAVRSVPTEHGGRYLYFDAHVMWSYDLDGRPVRISVDYLDAGPDGFGLHYDSTDREASVRGGAFKEGGVVAVTGTGGWKTIEFEVPDPLFADRANGADFRLAVSGDGELVIGGVRVEKLDLE